jgi:ATP-dependent RNA helicase RhlE
LNYFEELGVSPRLAKRLAEKGLTDPTPIQSKAIPVVLEGRDVMGLAQTGTGKTAAFGLPLIQLVQSMGSKPAPKSVRSLILAPTRELAKQIVEALRGFTGHGHMRIEMVVGGQSINVQIDRLKRGADILVATPGRLIDLLDRRAVSLAETRFLVLDEADQMLDMGFVHALRKIAPLLGKPRQTLLFSATMPKLMSEIAATFLDRPVRIEVSPPGKAADKVSQSVHFVAKAAKPDLLIEELGKHRGELALVFSRTKHGAERLMKKLVAEGFKAGSIHGNKSQGQRDRALLAFREGKLKVLVATDVAARGIDIPDVRFVYNFDLPNVPENYVHRIGRTARAGAEGTATSFCSADEMGELKSIEKVLGRPVPIASGRPWETHEKSPSKKPAGRRFSGKPGGGQGGNRRRSRRSKSGGKKHAA